MEPNENAAELRAGSEYQDYVAFCKLAKLEPMDKDAFDDGLIHVLRKALNEPKYSGELDVWEVNGAAITALRMDETTPAHSVFVLNAKHAREAGGLQAIEDDPFGI